jgi:hypothetical protein
LHWRERLAFTETSDEAACFQSSALPTELLGHFASNTTWTWRSTRTSGGHRHKDFSFGRTVRSLTCKQVSLHCNKLLSQRVVSPLLYRLSYLAPACNF